MSEWKPNPIESLKEQVVVPIRETLEKLRQQLEADHAALREFQLRRERSQRRP